MMTPIRLSALAPSLVLAVVLAACTEAVSPPPAPPPPPPPPAVTSVAVTGPAATVEVGSTLQLVATVAPAAAPQTVTWATDNAGRATVSASGLVTGVAPGAVTITATSTADATRSGSLQLTVTGCLPLVQADVSNGATLSNSCYRAQNALVVNSGTLTVSPGVRIEFGSNGALTIATGGRLNATGTVTQPILFTSIDAAGDWRGIRFDNTRSVDNRLHYATIRNGGSAGWSGASYSRTALYLDGNTLVDIRNSTIDGSGGQGVLITSGVEMTFENNRIHNTVIPIWVHPNAVHHIGASTILGSTQGSNVEHIVRVGFGNTDAVTTSQTWPHLVAAYEIRDRMFVRAALTIEKGTIVTFVQDASMIVETTGSLTAVGEQGPGTEILFTNAGRTQADLPGFWKGIQIQSASPNNRFEWVMFENGGSQPWVGGADASAMVFLDGTSRAVFRNCRFEGSGLYGLRVPAGGDISGFEGNSFVQNERAMIVHPNRAGAIAADNVFFANTENKVRVTFGNNDAVITAQTWKDFGTPFYVADRTFISAPLTIAAGTVVEFAADASLRVRDDGSLRAVGTLADPIIFRGGENVAGYWYGIEYGSVAVANQIEHAVFRNAGSGQWFGGGNAAASLYVNGDGFVALRDVRFEQSGGYAALVNVNNGITCTNVDGGGFMFRLRLGSSLTVLPAC